MSVPAICVREVSFSYGERQALQGVTFDVESGEIFGLLGPNGGGKTTLFRILSTTLPVQSGHALILEHDVASRPDAVRRMIGVTFQSPSLDPKLTVGENLTYQGHLYGLTGITLQKRTDELLSRLGLMDRKGDIAETLSGGLAQLAKRRKVRRVHARGIFVDSQTLQLEGGDPETYESERLTFDHCILATGSTPAMPGMFDIGSDRVMRTWCHDLVQLESRRLPRGGQEVVHEGRGQRLTLLVVDVLLQQRGPHPLRHAALHLTGGKHRIDDSSHVLHRDHVQHGNFARQRVDFQRHHAATPSVRRVSVALVFVFVPVHIGRRAVVLTNFRTFSARNQLGHRGSKCVRVGKRTSVTTLDRKSVV